MYEKLMSSEKWIPCQFHFHEAPEITRKLWLDRLMVERLENRYETIAAILESNKNNWEETFTNALPMGSD